MKPWGKQNMLKEESYEVPSIDYLIEMVEGINNLRLQCLVSLLYLSGARICEIVRKTGYDLIPIIQENESDKKLYRYNKVRNTDKNKPSIKKKQLNFRLINDRNVLVISIRNQKNKRPSGKSKSIPIPLDNEKYLFFLRIIKTYIDKFEDDEELFPFGYQYAHKLLKPYFNPHWFRHIRATHLTLNNNFSGPLLRKYMGWTDDRPTSCYLELKLGDLLEKL